MLLKTLAIYNGNAKCFSCLLGKEVDGDTGGGGGGGNTNTLTCVLWQLASFEFQIVRCAKIFDV